ncbi:MAG: hypothetical protein R6U57_00515, partial [Anaerolineales bacterium]
MFYQLRCGFIIPQALADKVRFFPLLPLRIDFDHLAQQSLLFLRTFDRQALLQKITEKVIVADPCALVFQRLDEKVVLGNFGNHV